MELEIASQGFAAVGSEPRLSVLLALVRAGPDGLSIGDIQERLNIPASTLAHHVRFLAAAGLVTQEKIGRSVITKAQFNQLEALGQFLLRECCADEGSHQSVEHTQAHRSGIDLVSEVSSKGTLA